MAATIGSTVQDLATPAVVVAEPDTLVLKAAQLMREHHVGALVVVDTTSGESRPVGIVTDRDLVLGVMAEGLDPAVFTVGDLMSTDLETIGPQAPLADAVSRLGQRGLRRLVVVDEAGRLAGILALEDLLAGLTGGFVALTAAVHGDDSGCSFLAESRMDYDDFGIDKVYADSGTPRFEKRD